MKCLFRDVGIEITFGSSYVDTYKYLVLNIAYFVVDLNSDFGWDQALKIFKIPVLWRIKGKFGMLTLLLIFSEFWQKKNNTRANNRYW